MAKQTATRRFTHHPPDSTEVKVDPEVVTGLPTEALRDQVVKDDVHRDRMDADVIAHTNRANVKKS